MELSEDRKKAIKTFRVRINRGIGIAVKNKSDNLDTYVKLLNFTDEELYTILHASAPVIPLLPGLERVSFYTYFMNFKRKDALKRTLRAIMIEALNSARLAPSSKRMFITYLTNGVAKGAQAIENVSDDSNSRLTQSRQYLFTLMTARDMFNHDVKNKKDELNVNFKEIENCFKAAIKKRVNFIELINNSDKLNRDDKQYMENVINDAKREFQTVEDLLNLQVVKNPPFNSSPLFVNGRSSIFKKDEKKTTYAEQLAYVGYDFLKFIGVDLELVCQIHKESQHEKKDQ